MLQLLVEALDLLGHLVELGLQLVHGLLVTVVRFLGGGQRLSGGLQLLLDVTGVFFRLDVGWPLLVQVQLGLANLLVDVRQRLAQLVVHLLLVLDARVHLVLLLDVLVQLLALSLQIAVQLFDLLVDVVELEQLLHLLQLLQILLQVLVLARFVDLDLRLLLLGGDALLLHVDVVHLLLALVHSDLVVAVVLLVLDRVRDLLEHRRDLLWVLHRDRLDGALVDEEVLRLDRDADLLQRRCVVVLGDDAAVDLELGTVADHVSAEARLTLRLVVLVDQRDAGGVRNRLTNRCTMDQFAETLDTQVLRLLAEHERDRVHEVRFAAAIWTDDRGERFERADDLLAFVRFEVFELQELENAGHFDGSLMTVFASNRMGCRMGCSRLEESVDHWAPCRLAPD